MSIDDTRPVTFTSMVNAVRAAFPMITQNQARRFVREYERRSPTPRCEDDLLKFLTIDYADPTGEEAVYNLTHRRSA